MGRMGRMRRMGMLRRVLGPIRPLCHLRPIHTDCRPLGSKPMRQRTARQGPNAGKPFWGCTGYPDCKGT